MADSEEQQQVQEDKEEEERREQEEAERKEKEEREKKEKEEQKKDDKEDKDAGRQQQREYFKEELKRLQTSLKRESSKIKPPPERPHFPNVFSSLEPYYNTYTARYLIESPEDVRHDYSMRPTAIGLCDPWVDLHMDRTMLPRITPRSSHKTEKKKAHPKSRGEKEGSTRLPKFPAVRLETQDLATRELRYSDVPMLRRELEKKYSSNATQKIEEDYKRTKQDYYRMGLDRLYEVHPVNRDNMRSAFFAYLQNTPGSKKAIYECVSHTDKEQDDGQQQPKQAEVKSG